MTREDFEAGGKPTFRDLFGAIDELRKEQRQDLKDMEGRLTNTMKNVLDEFRCFRDETNKKIKEIDASGSAALEDHINSTRVAEAEAEAKLKVQAVETAAQLKVVAADTQAREEILHGGWAFVSKNITLILVIIFSVIAFLDLIDLRGLVQTISTWFH